MLWIWRVAFSSIVAARVVGGLEALAAGKW